VFISKETIHVYNRSSVLQWSVDQEWLIFGDGYPWASMKGQLSGEPTQSSYANGVFINNVPGGTRFTFSPGKITTPLLKSGEKL